MVSSIKNGSSEIKYTYDKSGRIETVDNGKIIKYYYDNLGQVVREDNGELNKTIVYTYDQSGNILKVTEYPLATTQQLGAATKTVDYSYGDSNWRDKLTSYNGKGITYDAIGNPLTYDGYTFKWEGGRTLTSITGNSKNISYNYNSDGIRTDKTVDGVNYKYTLEGNKVVHEEVTNGSNVDKIVYNYGDSGLVGFTLNGTEYFYIRNSQTDIIGILDSNGTQVVSYTYDTWGKLISITGDKALGEKNPYRYRGYRYDIETGYYYLQSRYYNPEIGRFINADALGGNVGALLSHNIFAYCNNNPVIAKDPSGFRPIYTQGKETAAMRDASYEAMAKAASSISNRLSSISTSTSKSSSGFIMSVGTAVADSVIGSKIASKLGAFSKYREWTYNPSDYIYKLKLNKTGKALNVLKGVGAVTVGITSIQTFNNIRKGEIYGAVVDLGATVAGVGVGWGASFLASAAIATFSLVGAPAIAVTALGVGAGILGSYVISLGADYLKDKHYGR
ncbi:RHS repeat-associated core domain-containing protein [uncultured Clostridium sp.]|uniref:RHS repeat-associated core domain-containing protein n=1 Tax=uncultured Clostridium sp. TaxID=59620 RepID=UPI00321695B0